MVGRRWWEMKEHKATEWVDPLGGGEVEGKEGYEGYDRLKGI